MSTPLFEVIKREKNRQSQRRHYHTAKRKETSKRYRMSANGRGRLKEYMKKWRAKNPERMKAHLRKSRLKKQGLTQEQYDKLLQCQNGKCGVCGTTRPGGNGRFAIDHDHETNRVRGLLCFRCNTRLGELGDTIESITRWYEAVMRYLNRGSQ